MSVFKTLKEEISRVLAIGDAGYKVPNTIYSMLQDISNKLDNLNNEDVDDRPFPLTDPPKTGSGVIKPNAKKSTGRIHGAGDELEGWTPISNIEELKRGQVLWCVSLGIKASVHSLGFSYIEVVWLDVYNRANSATVYPDYVRVKE